jgi:hypothetical protein
MHGQVLHVDPVTRLMRVQTGIRAHPTLVRGRVTTQSPAGRETLLVHESKAEPIKQWQFGVRVGGVRHAPLRVEPIGGKR